MSCYVFLLPLHSKAILAGYKRCCHLTVFLYTLFLESNLLTLVLLCMEHSPRPSYMGNSKIYFITLILINFFMIFLKVGFVVLNVSCAWSSLRASDLCVCGFHDVWKFFSHYFFKCVVLFSLTPPSGILSGWKNKDIFPMG